MGSVVEVDWVRVRVERERRMVARVVYIVAFRFLGLVEGEERRGGFLGRVKMWWNFFSLLFLRDEDENAR